ncbi:PPE domain-containing protein (plasmid) [Mycolicibacterium psychrotolerans]|uniref:PPE domain-containing protein n=1 Tax=Mycolicibacterium psychrotolerans TaxID=216929 RepID=UPI003D66CF47
MSGGGLRVDPDGVHAAAARAAAAAAGAAPALPVTPCAADAASHAAASRLGLGAAAVLAATAALDEATAAAGWRLTASAETYVAQDITGAAGLRSEAGLGGASAESGTVVSPRVVSPVAVVSAGGVQPVTGKQAAELIHGGSATGMLAAAEVLDRHTARCEEAAADLGAARAQAQDSWSSAAAEEADARLGELADGYASQARAARELAGEIRSHAADFGRARAHIPAPQVFDDLEARIAAAVAANSHPGSLGTLTTPIHVLQAKLAAAHHDGLTGYAGYRADSDLTADGSYPSGPAVPQGDSGSSEDGSGSRPSDVGDAGANPLASGELSAPMEEIMQSVLPAVLGGVLGTAGGLVGALSGAAQQLQQVGTGLAGELAQGASGMLAADTPRGDFSRAGRVGDPGSDPVVPDGGGPQPGDTEPASVPGALSAPLVPAAAAAPAAASPVTFSAGVTPALPAPTPAGAAMLPPMMPMAGAGSSAAEDDQRLYGPRRLRVEAPPTPNRSKGAARPGAVAAVRGVTSDGPV